MIEEVQAIDSLITEYYNWLKDKTALKRVGDYVEITTPYLDRHNDYMQIYAKREDSTVLLTDDGYTIQDLRLSGCDLETPRRRALLDVTLNGFGVRRQGDSLQVQTTPQDFKLQKHNLVQSMLAVNDLFVLAEPNIASLFFEDVDQWLNMADVRFAARVKFAGASGYDHLFDFLIPASKTQPERILQAINRPTRESTQSLAFKWHDTRDARQRPPRAYAILNDAGTPPHAAVIRALRQYEILPVLWSERESVREDLAA